MVVLLSVCHHGYILPVCCRVDGGNSRISISRRKAYSGHTCLKQNINPDQLTIHADRGPSMRSKLVAQLMADMGITKTHSRPHTSNDNPYSEAQFKTMKYRHTFPNVKMTFWRVATIKSIFWLCAGQARLFAGALRERTNYANHVKLILAMIAE